jgi:metal-responsive CopG/Arc/MetJ family transcriptional regulator
VWHCKGIYRVSVDLPKELKARLAAEAKRRGISESELVRIALAKELPGKLSGAE